MPEELLVTLKVWNITRITVLIKTPPLDPILNSFALYPVTSSPTLILFSHLFQISQGDFFPSCPLSNILYAFFIFPVRGAYPIQLIVLDINGIILGEDNRSRIFGSQWKTHVTKHEKDGMLDEL